jgi:HEAT repeat protein/PBS lyase HEAT-like repeat-containing protein
LARRFEIPGGQILVWLGTDLLYAGVDVLDDEGTVRRSWEDEVDSEEDLIELITAARIPMEDAREIAHGLLEERKNWEAAQRGKRWWRWGRGSDPRAVERLTGLLADQDEVVRATAVRALGEIGHPSVIPVLLESAKDSSAIVRAWAAEWLSKLGVGEAAPLVARMLESDSVIERRAAAQALGRIGDRSAIPLVTEAKTRDRWHARWLYRKAVRQMAGRERKGG